MLQDETWAEVERVGGPLVVKVRCSFVIDVPIRESWWDGEARDLWQLRWQIEENSCPGTSLVSTALWEHIDKHDAAGTCWACALGGENVVVSSLPVEAGSAAPERIYQAIQPDGSLDSGNDANHDDAHCDHVSFWWNRRWRHCVMHGSFSPAELRAIADHMERHQ